MQSLIYCYHGWYTFLFCAKSLCISQFIFYAEGSTEWLNNFTFYANIVLVNIIIILWLLYTLHARRNACTAKDLNVHVYVIDFEAQMLHAMIVIMIQKYIKYFRYQPI